MSWLKVEVDRRVARQVGVTSLRFVCASSFALFAVVASGCQEPRTEAPQKDPVVPVVEATPEPEPVDPCVELSERLIEAEQLPGTPTLDKNRPEILARARSVPVVFTRAPEGPRQPSERVARFRKFLQQSKRPAHDIQEVLRKTRGRYDERREVFLSEGYLYAETPQLALRLSQILRLDHLFKDPELVIERGDEILRVFREEGRYFLPPDESVQVRTKRKPLHGGLAGLLLFDRVRTPDEKWGERLHLDLRGLQKEMGFRRAKVVARTPERWVARLDTYGETSQVVWSVDAEGRASVECEVADGSPSALEGARDQATRERELIEPVLAAGHDMIRRRLPFDEPRTEEGQQDGLLRIQFRDAYRRYRNKYEFNGDEYYVFDGYGRPKVPQVCIDFITDSFDLGTGGNWPMRGERRLRVKGALNFASLGIENPRSIESLAEWAMDTPEWFDMVWIEKKDRVKFRYREKFFAALERDADRYQLGDVVFIYGLRDDGKFHWHSFMVDQKDPISGIPTVVLANAGPPQARSWEGEMHNAPARSIVARMRVRPEILERAYAQAKAQPGVPLDSPHPPEEEESAADQ